MEQPGFRDAGFNEELLKAAIRFNAAVLGVVSGVLGSTLVYTATTLSLLKWGDNAGGYLGLLAVFLPGYSVSSVGALIGAFWAFIFSGLAGFLTYWLYGRILKERIATDITMIQNPVLKPSVLRMHGVSLGVALGTAMSLALFLSTAWLVFRGTASESVHAALLGNYLPGYSVSIWGGLLGSLELFLVVLVFCVILAGTYNKVADIRSGKG